MPVKRTLQDVIARSSQSFPVLLLTGPRQVGKTTLLQTAAGADRLYVTFSPASIIEWDT